MPGLFDDLVPTTPAPDFGGVRATVRGPAPMAVSAPAPAPAAPADAMFGDLVPPPDYSGAFKADVNPADRLVNAVGSGIGELAGFANILGMAPAAGIDLLHGALTGRTETGARDWVGDQATRAFNRADEMGPDPNTQNVGITDEVIHGAGKMLPDLAMMAATAGESAAVKPLMQGSVRQMVGRAVEQAGTSALRASAVPAAEHGVRVARDVTDRGGTVGEALGAGGGSAALTALTNMIPASASGNVLTRALQGAASNPVADALQTQGENALVDDRLGMDREYGAKDALIAALTGAPMAGIMGERGPQLETKADRAARDVADLDLASLDLLREQQAARTPAPAPEPAPPAPTVVPRQNAPEPAVADVPARAPESDADAFQRELAAAQAALAGGPGKGVDFASSERAPDDELARSLELDDAEYLRRVNPDKEVTGNGATDSLIGELGDREVPERATPIGELGNGITLHADGDYLYAADGDRVVGVLGAKPSGNEFAVDPEYQGRGIGTAMMKELLVRQPEALSGGLSPAAEKTRLSARKKLREERAPKFEPTESETWDDGTVVQFGKSPFKPLAKGERKPLTTPKDLEGAVVREVSLADLTSSQNRITKNGLDKPRDDSNGLPIVVREGGRMYIQDGHHRLAGQLFNGEKTARVRFIDKDTPPTAGVKAGEPPDQPTSTIAEDAPALREPLPDDPADKPFDHANHTSLKNEVRNESRALRGLSELASGETRANQTVIEEGRKAIEDDPEAGRRTVERIRNGGAITHADEGVLLAEDVRLRNARDAAQERAGDESLSPEERAGALAEAERHEQAIAELDEAARTIGTEGGRILQLRKRVIANDFSLQAMERKQRAALGRALTPAEQAELKTAHARIADLERQNADLDTQLDAARVQAVVDSIIAEARGAKAAPKKKKMTAESLDARAAAVRARIANRLGVPSMRGQSGAIDVGLIADYIELGSIHVAKGVADFAEFVKRMTAEFKEFAGIGEASQRKVWEGARAVASPNRDVLAEIDGEVSHKDVYDLARQKIEAGMHGVDDVMAAVHKDLKDAGHDLTERAVRRLFSEYGKARHPSQDAVKKELRELRALVQLQESIDRIEEGLLPLKSGPQRDKQTAEVRAKREELGKRLAALMREGKADPERLARYNELRATNLRKQIDALDREIATGEAAPRKGKGPQPNAEVARLKTLRDKLQGELDQMTAGDRRNASEKKALQKRIADVEAKLRGEGKPAPAPEARVDDAEQTALRQKLDTLRAQQRTAGATTARGEQLGAQIAELMQRLAGKPGEAKPAPKAESHPELVRIRDELQAQLRALDNPPKDPAVRHNERMGKLMQRRIAELQQRMDAGDFAVHKRTPKPLDAEREKLRYELDKVKHDFARQQFEAQMKARHPLKKILGAGVEAQNFARAVMTSFDFSALLRQGGFIAFGHPLQASKAAWAGLKAAVSAQKEHAINDEIVNRPNAPLYKRAGLHLSEHGTHDISKLEEQFVSRWIDKVPGWTVLGPAMRGSQRAYTTTLNRLRADSFDAMVASLTKGGTPTEAELKAIGNYINVATGRGVLGPNNKYANAAPALSAAFFAPRLVASRFNLLAGQPLYGGSARTRGLIAQEYARFLMGMAVTYGLAQLYAAGTDDDDGQVTFDPRSSDFGKIKFGNTYLDPLTGLAQVTALLGKEGTGQKITTKGDVRDLHKVGLFTAGKEDAKLKFGQDTGLTVLGRFLRTKLAPVPGAIADQLDFGQNVIGEKQDVNDSASGLIAPMSMRDIKDIMVEHGAPEGTALVLLSLLGMGVQHRAPREKDTKGN